MGRVPLLLILVGCAKSAPNGAVPPTAGLGSQMIVEAAPAVPLGGLDTPFERGYLPPLNGDQTTLDLKSLVRSQLDYTISMDTQPLADLDDDGQQALVALLAADPRWRVYQDHELLLAARRESATDGWSVSATGYHNGDDGPWRTVLRFGAYEPDHPWVTSPAIAQVPAGTTQARIRGFVPASSVYQGKVITAVRIEAPAVALDLYETGPEDGRPRTSDALAEVPSAVANAVMLGDRLRSRGHEPLLLPPKEPASAPVSARFVATKDGALDWRARVNPGEPGWVWLRLDQDGKGWHEPAIAAATRERVGWTETGERTFLAQSRFHLPDREAVRGTAEVWFLPDAGAARVLTRVPVDLPAR